MKHTFIKISAMMLAIVFLGNSCAKKLDVSPLNDLTPEKTYSTAEGYKAVLAKIYGTLSITGNQGPAGQPDISGGLDEGSQVAFIRMLFNCQELPTDEAVCAWNDQTIKDFHNLSWTPGDPFLKGIYARCIYNITLINEYMRESTDAKLAARNITGTAATDIKNSRAEARFLRAYNYWLMMDLFGKSTFITEDNLISGPPPGEKTRTELFDYIESELLAIDADLAPAKTIEYGRVDQAAAWALLARMYLNAKVYTGNEKYTEAITYSTKVINAGYSLRPNYPYVFMADNDKQKDEFIFAINCDGAKTQAYGNTTFFVHCAAGGDFTHYGVGGGWFGYRATKGLADKFTDLTGNTDKRALFTTPSFGTSAAQLQINDISNFNEGMHVAKYRNVRSDGGRISDYINKEFSDVDFPVFRLSEMYLIYAESVLRNGAGGNSATSLTYINNIRNRAGAGAISAGQLDLNFILDERARELYWEGHRRTDLIRYERLTTGAYLWPWKGGVASGTSVADKYNIFPVPAENITNNPNLTQNTGY